MLNQINLMGRICSEPELRYTDNQTSVLSFSVACERDFSAGDGKRPVDFIDCVAWRSTAEFISKYFAKGALICVDGRLQVRDWTDKEGNKRRKSEVVVDKAYFCGSNNSRKDDISAEGFEELGEDCGELPF